MDKSSKNKMTKEELYTKEIIDKCNKVASTNLWLKNGMKRVYINYDNKKFYIDIHKKVAAYESYVSGNICIIKKFLEEVSIDYKPLDNTYDTEIILMT